MATHEFSSKEAIRFGWDTMKGNIGFFIGLMMVVAPISLVPQIIRDVVGEDASVLSIIGQIVFLVFDIILTMGLIKIALRFCDNEKGRFADLFSCYPLFIKYISGIILYILIVFGGMILLIIPGIIWGVKFQLFEYFIVEKGLGPIESLKKSAEITTDVKWDLFLFQILLGLINLLGVLAFIIGLFATLPTTALAIAFVYRKLLAQTEFAQGSDSLSEVSA